MSPVSSSNAFLPESVPPQLAANGTTGALHAASLAVKDVFDVAGMATHAGSPFWGHATSPAPDSAAAVAVLLAQGAQIVGKTVSDELAFSLMGTNRHYPRPLNAAAPDRVTGGSSSGSVAAVGWGEAAIACATDTGGSIRAPASFCGLVGLRTTHGSVPMEGCVPLAPSFDTSGWFADTCETYRTVALASLSRPHVPLPSRPRARCCACLDELVEPASRSEYARMRGIVLDHLGPPTPLDIGSSIDQLYWCFRRLQAVEAWAMHGPFVTENGANMNEDVRERFEWARQVTLPERGTAMRLRMALRAWLADELEDDVLVLPTVPGPAPLVDAEPGAYADYRERALRLLCLAGLAGVPQITLPLGTVDGAPFGISLLARHGADLALIDLATAILTDAGARQSVERVPVVA